MTINELARTVHENAVAHGWWEDERGFPEIVALICSEWSEALEEARNFRPLMYTCCDACGDGPCDVEIGTRTDCAFRPDGKKPEGVAVELMDGVIRILDYLGHAGAEIVDDDGSPAEITPLLEAYDAEEIQIPLPELVAWLHYHTANAMEPGEEGESIEGLIGAMIAAMCWTLAQGLDPLEVILLKHAYNVTRPYKHGKKF